jgi:tRNA(fMet)-specific endonuclease VapC
VSFYVLDTDHVSLHQRKHPLVSEKIAQCAADELAVTSVTVGEQVRGRLAKLGQADGELRLAYAQLVRTVEYYCGLNVLLFDEEAQEIFQRLRAQKVRIGTLDLRIAAVVLRHQAILVTGNRQDFEQVPGLTLENWSR